MKITSTLKAKGSIIDGLKAVKKFSNTKFLADKIDSQEDIALLRAEVNRERINQGAPGRGN